MQFFKAPYCFVGKVADGAAAEIRQPAYWCQLMPFHFIGDEAQRVVFLPLSGAEYFIRFGANKAVVCHLFAIFHTLQKE